MFGAAGNGFKSFANFYVHFLTCVIVFWSSMHSTSLPVTHCIAHTATRIAYSIVWLCFWLPPRKSYGKCLCLGVVWRRIAQRRIFSPPHFNFILKIFHPQHFKSRYQLNLNLSSLMMHSPCGDGEQEISSFALIIKLNNFSLLQFSALF